MRDAADAHFFHDGAHPGDPLLVWPDRLELRLSEFRAQQERAELGEPAPGIHWVQVDPQTDGAVVLTHSAWAQEALPEPEPPPNSITVGGVTYLIAGDHEQLSASDPAPAAAGTTLETGEAQHGITDQTGS
jgi:hypothetical protein